MTAKQVAMQIDVPVTTYREWEYGRAIIGTEPYLKLAKIFQLGVHELMSGEKPREHSEIIDEIREIRARLEKLQIEFESHA